MLSILTAFFLAFALHVNPFDVGGGPTGHAAPSATAQDVGGGPTGKATVTVQDVGGGPTG